MCNERVIRRLAGLMVLASAVLAWQVSPWWLLLTAFVGANLLQYSFTDCCPAEWVFGRLGVFGCRTRTPGAERSA
jgi:hypothetical protein